MTAVQILMFSERPFAKPPFVSGHLEGCAESGHLHQLIDLNLFEGPSSPLNTYMLIKAVMTYVTFTQQFITSVEHLSFIY